MSTVHSTFSGLSPPILLMVASSSGVRSLSQPIFCSRPIDTGGWPSLISAPDGIALDRQQAVGDRVVLGPLVVACTLSTVRPQLTRKLRPPSADGLGRVVEVGRAGMLHGGGAPARPRQAVVVAVARAAVGLQRHLVEGVLVGHVQLQPLGALAGVADGPHALVELAGDVLHDRLVLLDLDVLEHLLVEAELLGEEIHDLVVGLGLEERPEHLLAPLQRAVGGRHRARPSRTASPPAAGRRRRCGRAARR